MGVSRQEVTRSDNIRLMAVTILLVVMFSGGLNAGQAPQDLKKLSLEELVNIEVTSVSKKVEKLTEAAAAVSVITSEDIRRSGATSIAEALRMVPGLQVARSTASQWAITSRGFSGNFANKLLVLIDGRSVYTPLFSGVLWGIQDVLLEDIDQIEVVRGPGGTLWGANAVNGVINIITKNSAETQKTIAKVGIGTEEQGFVSFRRGGRIGPDATFRVYGKYNSRDNFIYASGEQATDKWDIFRGGLRIDWKQSDRNSYTLMGDVYNGDLHRSYRFAILEAPWSVSFHDTSILDGGNILGRWNHRFTQSSEITFQAYFDRTEMADEWLKENRNTFDLDLHHNQRISSTVTFLYGFGYRRIQDGIDSTSQVWLLPPERTDNLYSVFAQTNFSFAGDRLRLTIGSKFEHNDYTEYEFQPGVRLLWLPLENHTVWAAVARAVRTPSRVEHDGSIVSGVIPPLSPSNPGPLPIQMLLSGNRQFESEELTAYEVGYRIQPTAQLSLDLAGFYNDYEKLRNLVAGAPVPNALPPAYLIKPINVANEVSGEACGLELAADWRVSERLTFKSWYAYTRLDLSSPDGANEDSIEDSEKAYPRNQAYLRTIIDIADNIEFDAGLRYVDALVVHGIDSYQSLDIRLGWTPVRNVEISVVGQNLFERHHTEFQSELNLVLTEVERGMYISITWNF